jgi:hypothetical protein
VATTAAAWPTPLQALADARAGADATPEPDAPPPQVTLVATDGDGPLAGVRVAFLDAADAVVLVTTTDASGMARASLPLGGKVLAAEVGAERVNLWLGARPGDVLRVRYGDSPPTRLLDVAVPALPAQGNVYEVHTQCGDGAGTTSPVSVNLPTACTSSDVAVVARDDVGGHAGGFLATGQTLPPSGTLDLSARTFTPAVSRTFTVTGLDSGEFTSLNSSIRVGASGISIPGLSGFGTVAGGAFTATAAQADLPGADWVTRVIDRIPNGGQLLYQRAAITTTSFDVGPVRLVEPTVPTYAEASREVTWAVGSTGRPYDGVFVQVRFLLADQTLAARLAHRRPGRRPVRAAAAPAARAGRPRPRRGSVRVGGGADRLRGARRLRPRPAVTCSWCPTPATSSTAPAPPPRSRSRSTDPAHAPLAPCDTAGMKWRATAVLLVLGCGRHEFAPRIEPDAAGPIGADPVVQLSGGGSHSCARTAAGEVWCWGDGRFDPLGPPRATARGPTRVALAGPALEVIAGEDTTCAVTGAARDLLCWGHLPAAAAGDPTPRRIELPGPVTTAAVGEQQWCVLLGDGSVWCWGGNRCGAVGDGTTTPRPQPTQVLAADTGATALSVADVRTCALVEGQPVCWGAPLGGRPRRPARSRNAPSASSSPTPSRRTTSATSSP